MGDIILILIAIGVATIGEKLKVHTPSSTSKIGSELHEEKRRLAELHFGKDIFKD